MEHIRPHLDITLALLTALVALYFRAPSDKRAAFEKANPRIASIIGIVAGIVPFLPMIASGVKGVITGQHPSATGTQATNHVASAEVPDAPWSEAPSDVPITTQETR